MTLSKTTFEHAGQKLRPGVPHRLGQVTLLSFGLLCAAGAVGVVVVSIPHPAHTKRSLVVDESVHDFGELRQLQKVHATFHLRIRSIRVLRTTTNCGCTVADLRNHILLADESTDLTVTLDVGKNRGDLSKHVLVEYLEGKDNRKYSLVLQLKASVRPEYDVVPARLQFKKSRPGKHTVAMTSNELPELRITKTYSTHKAVSAELIEPTTQDRSWKVQVAFEPEQWEQSEGLVIVALYTNSETEPVYNLHVNIVP